MGAGRGRADMYGHGRTVIKILKILKILKIFKILIKIFVHFIHIPYPGAGLLLIEC